MVAALLLAAVAGGCGRRPTSRAQQFIASGDRHAKAGNLAAADIEYRNALRALPSSVDAHARLLDVAMRRHDPATVAREVLALAELVPEDAAIQMRAGEVSMQMGRFAEAEQAFNRAAAADEHLSAPHRALALLHMRQQQPAEAERQWRVVAASPDGDPFALADFHAAQGRLDEAEAELRALVGTVAERDAARLRLARVLHQKGRRAEGDRLLDSIARHDRRNAVPWIVRGQLDLAEHRPADAARAFAAALNADPTSLDALTALTALDLEAKRVDDAVGRVERVLASSPDAVPVLRLAGRMYESVGRHDKAEARLAHAIQVAPSELDAYTLLGAVYVRDGRLAEARTQFASVAERQPDNVWAVTMIGMLFEAEGRDAEAQTTYEQLLAKYPHAGVAANNLACLYARHGRLDDALRYAEIGVEELRHLPQASDTLGWIYCQRKQPNEALPLLSAAAERQPDNPVYHFHLGMAYADTGAVAQARSELARALAGSPAFPGRDDALRRKTELDRAADAKLP